MIGDQSLVDRLCRERREVRTKTHGGEQVQASRGDVGDARREAKAEHVTECEDMIGDATPIGMVAFDREIGTVMEQAVEDMHRFAGTGRYDPGMERRVMVGDVRVEGDGGIAARLS